MEPPRDDPPVRAAPRAEPKPLGRGTPWPDLDDHVVEPETREEMLHGERYLAMAAKPPHARLQFNLACILGPTLAPGYIGAIEMLTRTSEDCDFAPDASVYRAGPDPETGGRRLEELAFEVCSEQELRIPTLKARELIRRGVRRVFCILVAEDEDEDDTPPKRSRRRGRKENQLLEWSRETDGWSSPLPREQKIDDPCFAEPLPVWAFLEAAARDDAVAEVLRRRKHRVFSEERAAGFEAGEVEGRAAALLDVLAARGFDLPREPKNRIRGCADPDQLRQWIRRAASVSSLDELWDED